MSCSAQEGDSLHISGASVVCCRKSVFELTGEFSKNVFIWNGLASCEGIHVLLTFSTVRQRYSGALCCSVAFVCRSVALLAVPRLETYGRKALLCASAACVCSYRLRRPYMHAACLLFVKLTCCPTSRELTFARVLPVVWSLCLVSGARGRGSC